MPRWGFLLGGGVGLITMGFLLTDWMVGALPGITERNAKRIRGGMSPTEAKALLGRQCDEDWPVSPLDARARARARFEMWLGDQGEEVVVEFDAVGKVREVEFSGRSPLGHLSLILKRLGFDGGR